MLKENADKVPEATKTDIDAAVADARTKLDSEDKEVLEAARTALETKFHKLSQELYKKAGAQAQQGAESKDKAEGRAKSNDDVVDAEYEEGSPS